MNAEKRAAAQGDLANLDLAFGNALPPNDAGIGRAPAAGGPRSARTFELRSVYNFTYI